MAYKVGDVVKVRMGLRHRGAIGEIIAVSYTQKGRTYTVRIMFGPHAEEQAHYRYEQSLEVLGDEH